MNYPKYRKLRIPTNWFIQRPSLYDIAPDTKEKFKTHPEDDGWTIFEQYLLYIEYGIDRRWCLEVLWLDPFDSNGKYTLCFSDASWIHKSPNYQEMTVEEIVKENQLPPPNHRFGSGLQFKGLTALDFCKSVWLVDKALSLITREAL